MFALLAVSCDAGARQALVRVAPVCVSVMNAREMGIPNQRFGITLVKTFPECTIHT